ncbi:MAG TPA: MXAN_6640 family putative metalloprotease [Candidatus Acidoferrum sp.]|nr:MXAN_6640 family putative metalloprotease [Candidatus Acidoferrum sp.]
MKLTALVAAMMTVMASVVVADDAIPREEQIRIVQDYLYVMGRSATPGTALSVPAEGEKQPPVKCGTSAVADFVMNRHRIDKDLLGQMALTLNARPSLSRSYGSPSGKFLIHYTTTGDTAVYQPTVDNNHNGVPDFVDKVAEIADSVYYTTITVMGYPAPPSDSFYAEGGDARYDIYLTYLGPNFYGLSYLDSTYIDGPGSTRATSFIVLDRSYSLLEQYSNRPLDAVRVTMAHEFFHAVQFGINFTEAENYNQTLVKRYWMEMSATWMEEQQYTDINDYYNYLPYFYNDPTASLQQFNSYADFHPYGAAVFPIYLSQKFGRDLIRAIWLKSGTLGPGTHFWPVLSDDLDSCYRAQGQNITTGTGLPMAVREFALWNYYTGSRAYLAPHDSTGHQIGFPEKANYPAFPDASMGAYGTYPLILRTDQDVLIKPQQNGAGYIRFDGTGKFKRRYFTCGGADVSQLCVLHFVDSLACTGSTEIPDSLIPSSCLPSDTFCTVRGGCGDTALVTVDSVFTVFMAFDQESQPWGVSIVYNLNDFPDSQVVESGLAPALAPTLQDNAYGFEVLNPRKFCSATFIVTPASIDIYRYTPGVHRGMAWVVDEVIDTTDHRPCGFDTTTVNVSAAILDAYPNPAVVAQMNGQELRFRFKVPTDTNSFPTCVSPTMVVDLFNVAGEYVSTIERTADLSTWRLINHQLVYEFPWDMKNRAGKDVASGVYLCVARLYCDPQRNQLLLEDKTKVAVIR